MNGEGGRWERGGYLMRQGRGSWLVCKVNDKKLFKCKKRKKKEGGKEESKEERRKKKNFFNGEDKFIFNF